MRFRVLGPVAADDDQRGPVPLGSARQRTVLAVLLVEPGVAVSFDQLVDRVWGPAAPQRARQTLHSYLSRLRGVLGPAGGPPLVRRGHGCALEVAETAVDVHRFRGLAAQARAAGDDERAAELWCEALGWWRGAPFADLDSDWLQLVGVGWQAERLAAVLDRNEVLLRRGEHARLVPELSTAAAEHPLDERLAGQLMLALYRCGRQADALACYRRVHDRLVAELGSDPGPALRQLHQRILRQEEPAPPAPVVVAGAAAEAVEAHPAPAQLPADVAGFTGRVGPLRQLDALLAAGAELAADQGAASTVVVSAIGGCAGVGKTALAVHWAHRVADRFPDGQLYLNLRGFDPAGQALDPARALRVLLELLQVPPQQIPTSLPALVGLYRSRLAGVRMLVVLDNARDAEQVRPLLPGSPGSMALVTSRDQLAGLVATEAAHPVRLDVLDDAEARLLLTRRLGPERVAAEPAAVEVIVRACAGLPLALAIVAARAATHPDFPLSAFAAELADARLDALSGPDTATDVRAVFACSYQALSPPAARLFRLLALHPGPDIGLPAAASLAGAPAPQARRLVAELTTAHLLAEPTPGRYTFHDLLRAYATELAEVERPEATERLLDHYVHTAARAAHLINSYLRPVTIAPPRAGVVPTELSTPEQATGWLATERPALLGLLDRAAGAGHDRHTWQLAWALRDFLDRRGHWHDLLAIQQAALTATQRLADQEMQALAHRNLSVTYRHLGRFSAVETHLRQALVLYEAIDDLRGQAMLHVGSSIECDRQGRYQAGLSHTQRAAELYRGLGDPVGEAVSLSNSGWFHTKLGNHRQALVTCRQAAATLKEHGHHTGEAHAWDCLGVAHHRLGERAQAVECYQRAVALFHRVDHRYPEADSLTRLGEVHHDAGDPAAARDAWQRALEILDEIGHPDADDLRKRLA
jgi:DNA-binding SARP family transcriptional activator